MQKRADNLPYEGAGSEACSVCRDLLLNLDRFLDMIETARRNCCSEWLTVDDIASELKVSKSIVYRLIRNGELEAINIVETNGRVPKKGHYRTRRASLEKYLESRKVRSSPSCRPESPRMPRLPRFKNYLGL